MFGRLLYRELHEQRPVLLVGLLGLAAVAIAGSVGSPNSTFSTALSVGFFAVLWPTVGAVAASIAYGNTAATEYVATLSTSPATAWLAKTLAGLLGLATLAPGMALWSAIGTSAPVNSGPWFDLFWGGDMVATGGQLALTYSDSVLALVSLPLLSYASGALLSSLVTGGSTLVLASLLATYGAVVAHGWVIAGLGWMKLPEGLAAVLLAQATLLLLGAFTLRVTARRLPPAGVACAAGLIFVCASVPFAVWANAGTRLANTGRTVTVHDLSAASRVALLSVWDEKGNHEVWVQNLDSGLTVARTSRGCGLPTFLGDGRHLAYRTWARSWGLLSPVAQTRVLDLDTGADVAWIELSAPRRELVARLPFPAHGAEVSPGGRWLAQKHGSDLFLATADRVQRVDLATGTRFVIVGWVRDPAGLLLVQETSGRDAWTDRPIMTQWALVEIDPETGHERTRLELPDTRPSVRLGRMPVTGTMFKHPTMGRHQVVVNVYDGSEPSDDPSPSTVLLINLDTGSFARRAAPPGMWVNADATKAFWVEGHGKLSAVSLDLASARLAHRELGTSVLDLDYPFSGIAASPDGEQFVITDNQDETAPVVRVLRAGDDARELADWRAIRFLSNHEVIVERSTPDGSTILAVWKLETGTTQVFFGPDT